MAQQVPAGFVPDGFVPDSTEPEGFVPDGFVPDTPSPQNKSVVKGPWWNPIEMQEGPQPDLNRRPDKSLYKIGGITERWDEARRSMIDQIAASEYIPEFMKPGLATTGSLMLEPARFITEVLSEPQPEDILMPGVVKPRASFRPRSTIVPEVLPPEVPVPKKAPLGLPPSPYIASETGQVQRRSLLTPQEEARLAGFEFGPDGPLPVATGDPAHFGTDIAELRERNRLQNTFYTGHEQGGGTSLTIPDRPFIDAPPIAGETGLGFDPVSQGPLEYPLNVVPEAVRPRSTQEVTRALAGDEFARPQTVSEPVIFESAKPIPENPIPPKPDMRGGTAAIGEGERILPSATRTPRASRAKVKEDTGLDISDEVEETISKAPESVKQGARLFVNKAASDSPSVLFKSIYTQLGELGQAGKQLVHRFQRAAQHRAEYDAAWTEPLFKVASKLKKHEHEFFGAYVEGRMPIPNERVRVAVEAWRQAQTQMGDMAVNVGLHLKRGKKVIPFEKRAGDYWPHVPAEQLLKEDVIDRLMSRGMTRHDAIIVAKEFESSGEIFLSGQHSRFKDEFHYRDDFDVATIHGRVMSKRIANHVNLGPKDVAGWGSEGIANLIEDTTDPDLAIKLAKRLAGRDALPSEKLMKGLNRARQFASLTSLPNFTLPNIILGQSTNAFMALSSRHPVAAFKEIMKLFSQHYRDEIRAAGVFNSFNKTLLEEMGSGKIDPFRIGAGEKINRMIAAAIGKSTVREAFADFVNTGSDSARYFLETLTARPAEEIVEITPELERFAAGRMAEITQGLTSNPGNMPYGWSNPVNTYGNLIGQLSLIFKKVGFQVTKTAVDTMKADPYVAIPAWIATTQIAGEMVGDTKSAITGKERPEDVMRIFDNWGNAFMLGLPWELATSAQYGPTSLVAAGAGPVFSKASEFAYDVYQSGERLATEGDEPFAPLIRFGQKNLPIPGRERLRGEP